MDEPAPVDPFATPLKRASDLLLFDPRAGAFQRVKIAGQVLSEHGGEYFLMQGTNGLRFMPKTAVQLHPGDLVEVVGFPGLGGPSPVLREAVVRLRGNSGLPAARPLPADALVSRRNDANWSDRITFGQCRHGTLRPSAGLSGGHARVRGAVGTREGWLRGLRPGSRIELTGVYAGQGGDPASGRDIDSFELLLHSPADLSVLEQPSWWTLRRLLAPSE